MAGKGVHSKLDVQGHGGGKTLDVARWTKGVGRGIENRFHGRHMCIISKVLISLFL